MNNAESTRERILNAAFELISSRGYLRSSTREIAQQAQVAEVTLFRQFASKERLFAEVLRSFSSIPTLTELVPQLKLLPYEEALKTLTSRFLEQLETNRNWIRLLSNELSYAPEEMKTVYSDFLKHVFDVLTDFFSDARDRRFIRPDLDPEQTARAFHSMVFGFSHIEGLCVFKIDHVAEYANMVDAFVDIFSRGTRAQD